VPPAIPSRHALDKTKFEKVSSIHWLSATRAAENSSFFLGIKESDRLAGSIK
jgi:hypothetical protein